MKTQVYLICSLLIALSSCKKEYSTTVEGTVVNSGTKLPIDSVQVVLQDGIGASGALGGGHTVGDGSQSLVYTNKAGHFKVTLEGESPFLYIKKNRYSWYYKQEGAAVGVQGFKPGNNYSVTLEMDAEASFQPVLKSLDKSTSDDIVKFLDGYTYPIWADFEQYGNSTSEKFYGIGPFSLYHTISANAIGDKYRTFKIGLWRNNTIKIKIDSVYIKSFTTYTDTIYY